MAIIAGTSGNDVLIDTAENDVLEGLAGDDMLSSTLDGEDILRGGGGNDTLFARRYYYNGGGTAPGVQLDGGAGDDLISVEIYGRRNVTAIGGAGVDRIILGGGGYTAIVDAGEGNDYIELGPINSIESNSVTATLGSGADTVLYNATYGNLTVTDFSAASGDRVVFGDVLANLLPTWDQASNPFSSGFLTIAQVGSDVAIGVNPSAGSGSSSSRTIITLQNVSASTLTAASLGGYAPDGSAPSAVISNGTSGSDQFEASPGNDQIDGGGGSDTILGGAGDDTLHGGDGADTVIGGLGSDTVFGDVGNDTLSDGYGANNQLYGDAGDDQVSMVYAGSFFGGTAASFGGMIDGGSGNDLIKVIGVPNYYSASGGYSKSIINVYGGEGDDRVDYRDATGSIDLGSGNDRLTLQYNNNDTPGRGLVISTGTGQDTIAFEAYSGGHPYAQVKVIDFTAGDSGDVIDLTAILTNVLSNWDGSTNPFATGHLRLIQQQQGYSDLVVDLDGSAVNGSSFDFFINFSYLNYDALSAYNFGGYAYDGSAPVSVILSGSAGSDFLTGGVGSDTIRGFSGDDILVGGAGNDNVDGGDGNDRISGGFGADILIGGAGNDIIVEQTRGGDKLYGGDGDDILSLTAESVYGASPIISEVVIDGGNGDDVINYFAGQMGLPYGYSFKSSISGGAGNDRITVGNMSGGGTIEAGSGDDRIEFQSNNTAVSTISLGTGQDTIILNNSSGAKIVTDFKAGESGDRLEISGYSGTLSLTQVGTSTVISVVFGGYSQTVVTLQNVKSADLSIDNIGFASGVYSPTGTTLTGADGSDDLTGADGNDQIFGGAGNDTLSGSGGNDVISGGTGNDLLDGGSGNDQLDGGVGFDTVSYARASAGVKVDLAITGAQSTVLGSDTLAHIEGLIGSSFGDDLRGNADNNEIYGGAGNDSLFGGAGDDRIQGGSGFDQAAYASLFTSYLPELGSSTVLLHGAAAEGADTLLDVERINFRDGVLQFDDNAAYAQVERLYDTVLQRAPDDNGLEFYVDIMEDRNVSLVDVANDLVGSAEFQAATGGLSNAQFVEYVYQHALGRAPDTGGAAYYKSQLDQGLTRGQFVVSLSESVEHRAGTAALVNQGFFNTDDVYQNISLIYDAALGRLPDAGGLTFYAESVKSGQWTYADVTRDFARSQEFEATVFGKSSGQIVDLIYQNTLDRAPDAGGRAYYSNLLDHGADISVVLQDIALSQEHFNLYSSHIVHGIELA